MNMLESVPTPSRRLRRGRRSATLRRMVRETQLTVDNLIAPLFIVEGQNIRKPISSMPGQFQLSLDQLGAEIDELVAAQIPSVLLFGIPLHKDAQGSAAWDANGPVASAIRAIKQQAPQLVVIADVCMCEYTDHGHCGILTSGEPETITVDNDPTLELLARASVAYAAAGADVVAPSAMMDGQIAAIRHGLDQAGYHDTIILSYAAKFASAFYGPFREAAESTPQFGDRRSYQMDASNAREALAEVGLDVAEGADWLMVKPAGAYLDIIRAVYEEFNLPLAAYQVSGEYAMIKAAAANGWIDEQRVALESLLAIRRAGASMIITYYAKEAAKWLKE